MVTTMPPNPNELTQQAAYKLSAWLTKEGIEHTVGEPQVNAFHSIPAIYVIIHLSRDYTAVIDVSCPWHVVYSIRTYKNGKSADYMNMFVQGTATGVENSIKRAINFARDKISNDAEDLSNEIKSTMEAKVFSPDISRIKLKYQYQITTDSGLEFTLNSDTEADEFARHYSEIAVPIIRIDQRKLPAGSGKFSPWVVVYDRKASELADLSSEISSLGESVRSLTE
jgi:hypothetical protein